MCENKRNSTEDTFGFIVTAIVCIIVGFLLGFGTCSSHLEKDAIKHNAAHYDTQTGSFTWNQ